MMPRLTDNKKYQYRVCQLKSCHDFEHYEPQLATLMKMYGQRWGERPGYTLGESLENILHCESR